MNKAKFNSGDSTSRMMAAIRHHIATSQDPRWIRTRSWLRELGEKLARQKRAEVFASEEAAK